MHLDITCSTDDNYIQHCAAMLCSLFENNREHKITVHLLHNNLSEKSQSLITDLANRYNNKVVFYNIDLKYLRKAKIREDHPNLSLATYFRILLPSIIDDSINKILYLDCDVIVLKDISNLFNIELENYGIAGCIDATPTSSYHRRIINLSLNQQAFCAGVIMINLQYWREHDSQAKMLEYIDRNSGKLVLEDQDVLNHEFSGKWFKLPPKYGHTPLSMIPLDSDCKDFDYLEYSTDPCIYHYAGPLKPWIDVWFPGRKYYIEYLNKLNLPNLKLNHISNSKRWQIRIACIRYYLNKYIHPLVPNVIEIPLKDLYNYICIIHNIFNPKQLNKLLIKLWIDKYK